jgi:GNAT superfamily N-acetyltransferase
VADALAVGQPTVVKLEMVHASWQMRGLLEPLPLSLLYDTEEDFFAILLANVYASETGRAVGLRSDHHGFEHLNTDIDHLDVLPSSQGEGVGTALLQVARGFHGNLEVMDLPAECGRAPLLPTTRFSPHQRDRWL